MKKTVLAAVLMMVCGGAAVAQPYAPYGSGPGMGGYAPGNVPQAPYGYRMPRRPAAPAENPGALLREGVESLVAFLSQEPMPDLLKTAAFLENEIAPYFDFAYMAKASAGSMARQMDEAQMARLEGKLKELFLGALAQRVASFDQQQVVYLPPRRGRSNSDMITLSIGIQNAGGYPAQLDFRLRRGEEGWKVVDVAANGSSALAYYRNYFRQVATAQRSPEPYGGRYR